MNYSSKNRGSRSHTEQQARAVRVMQNGRFIYICTCHGAEIKPPEDKDGEWICSHSRQVLQAPDN